MAAPRVMLLFLLLVVGGQKSNNVHAKRFSISVHMFFLRADESNSYGVYREGDTAIIVCRARDLINGGPLNVVGFEWLRYGLTTKNKIADMDQIIFFDGRDRFSRANLTYIEAQNLTDYRITVSDLDRYDSGNRFFCTIGISGSGSTHSQSLAGQLRVRWDMPSAQCSSSINTTKNIKGEDVSYSCNVTDTDLRSNGRVSLLKNDAKLSGLGLTTVKETNQRSLQFYADYSTQITDDSATDVYTCRYTATGGFEDYSANCTFNRPSCVVEDLADECPSRAHAITMATASMLLVIINCLV